MILSRIVMSTILYEFIHVLFGDFIPRKFHVAQKLSTSCKLFFRFGNIVVSVDVLAVAEYRIHHPCFCHVNGYFTVHGWTKVGLTCTSTIQHTIRVLVAFSFIHHISVRGKLYQISIRVSSLPHTCNLSSNCFWSCHLFAHSHFCGFQLMRTKEMERKTFYVICEHSNATANAIYRTVSVCVCLALLRRRMRPREWLNVWL